MPDICSKTANTTPHQTSILVLGAGELGMSVLRALARRADSGSNFTLTVLRRPQADRLENLREKEETAELRSLGVGFVYADLANSSVEELAGTFAPFGTVVGCTGVAAGRSIQLKLARAALAANVARDIPWQFGVDYDVIGRGSAQDLFDEQLNVARPSPFSI